MAATIVTSIITGGSNSHATTSYEANAFATDFVGQGIVGSFTNTLGVAPATGAYAVNAQGSPAMFVDVTAGVAWITATPSGQPSQSLRAYMSSNYTSYAISSNSSGSTKYDWIYLKVDPAKAGGTEDSAADDVTALYTSRSSSITADNGSPPTYGLLLAIVTVANGASSITNANVQDKRVQATPSAQVSVTGTGWTASTAPTSCAALGNRSYTVTVNGTDLTGTLSPGMRLKLTRTVAAPTQSTLLNGSTQYYSKSSPAGMTFTNNFVVSAWVKLTSYATGMIASRYNGTSGWQMSVNGSAQLSIVGYNGGSANFAQSQTYQSLPLNKWVHVACQLDMTTTSTGGTNNYILIDGIEVPNTVTRGGTNPTALIQAGNLEIGSWNGGLLSFAGQLAQVAIYSAKVTEANIIATISQTLVGTETSLISAYSFNNSLSDLNANANNLTANGSAVATNADTPFTNSVGNTNITAGTTNYAIVTAVSFSTNTTITCQVPEGGTIPTSGGVSAMSFSNVKAPYGFPAQRTKWLVLAILRSDQSQSSATSATWYNIGSFQLNIPIGEWKYGYEAVVRPTDSTNGPGQYTTLSSGSSSESDPTLTDGCLISVSNSTLISSFKRESDVSLAAATIYYLNHRSNTGHNTVTLQVDGASDAPAVIKAELSYL